MKLKDLLKNIDVISSNVDMDTQISGISYDSRKVQPGHLFVAVKGLTVDGHRFIPKAMELGATAVVNGREVDTVEEIMKLTGGKGADLVIEAAGSEITTRQAIHFTKKGATIVLVGYSASGELTLPMSLALDKELTFKTVFRYRHFYPMAIEAVASGKVNLKGIVTDIFPLDDIQNGLDKSVANKADIVKSVIKVIN